MKPTYEELESQLKSLQAQNEVMLSALEEIHKSVPASQDGGGLIVEHFDQDGNYLGSQNVDPISVIQFMSDVAQKALSSEAIQSQLKKNEARERVVEKARKVCYCKDHQEFLGELFEELSNLEKLKNE